MIISVVYYFISTYAFDMTSNLPCEVIVVMLVCCALVGALCFYVCSALSLFFGFRFWRISLFCFSFLYLVLYSVGVFMFGSFMFSFVFRESCVVKFFRPLIFLQPSFCVF